MPINIKEPLYTVEQLALIKRLRESGITKRQVEYVYETYDKLDKDLGSLYHIPVALEMHAQALQQLQQLALGLASLQNSSALSKAMSSNNVFSLSGRPPVVASIPDEPSRSARPLISVSNEVESSPNHPGGAVGSYVDGQPEVDTREYLDFISQGGAACCDEIRNFVSVNGIKQHQVSCLAGICQTYVSRYMKGDYADMSDRSCKTIQMWYLTYRHDPAAIGRAANVAQLLNGSGITSSSPGSSSATSLVRRSLDVALIANNPSYADLLSCPRRERFVFRPNQLEILERRFVQNSYPSYETRAEIANECCAAAEVTAGRKLNERESVSVSVISNWFANKRKDLKKAAKEGGLDVSGMLMTRRGRPPKPLQFATVKSELVNDFTPDENAFKTEQHVGEYSPDESVSDDGEQFTSMATAEKQPDL